MAGLCVSTEAIVSTTAASVLKGSTALAVSTIGTSAPRTTVGVSRSAGTLWGPTCAAAVKDTSWELTRSPAMRWTSVQTTTAGVPTPASTLLGRTSVAVFRITDSFPTDEPVSLRQSALRWPE